MVAKKSTDCFSNKPLWFYLSQVFVRITFIDLKINKINRMKGVKIRRRLKRNRSNE